MNSCVNLYPTTAGFLVQVNDSLSGSWSPPISTSWAGPYPFIAWEFIGSLVGEGGGSLAVGEVLVPGRPSIEVE